MTIMVVRRSGLTGGTGGGTWGSMIMPAALSAAVLTLLAAQLLSGASYSSTRDPLSGLEWTAQGWLFPVALLVLAVGLFSAAGVAGAVRRWGSLPAVLLALAGTGGVVAALYPSDPPDALVMTGVGEVHRWASTAVLVLPLVATLRVTALLRRESSLDAAVAVVRRRLLRLLALTAMAGAVFLGGFLPAILHSTSGIFAGLTSVNGLSQRVLAILMVVCVWQIGSLARSRSAQSGSLLRSDGSDRQGFPGDEVENRWDIDDLAGIGVPVAAGRTR